MDNGHLFKTAKRKKRDRQLGILQILQYPLLRRAKNHDILTACHRNNAMLGLWFGIVDTLCSACGPPSTSAVFFFAGIVLENSTTHSPFCQYIVYENISKTQHIVFF